LGCLSINMNRSPHRFQQAQDQFQQGGLAASVGTDNGHEIFLPDGKVHILKYGFSAIGKIKISNIDDRHKVSTRLSRCFTERNSSLLPIPIA
jgi:hypothetical protein